MVLKVQPHTVFITFCQTQSTAAENTKILHAGCPSSHLQDVFISVSHIHHTNVSIFQVMLNLDKALQHSSESHTQKHLIVR